ncbi:hypothetical protein GQ44DRAFT_672815 [Phaeosphaeriaceae sp. PMI808]|nr:hypothetical protein GQ44DRAFT_672815 [Phaeosphaeriaceae sp. PMI808]
MGRSRSKFSFPIPGRRSQKTSANSINNDDDHHYHNPARTAPSTPSAHEWPSRLQESSSKAHRVLGTSEPMYRTTSKASAPPTPGYMSVTMSEASFGSQKDTSTQKRPGILSRRPSSNIMGRAFSGDGRQGSDQSTASHRLHPQASNSTMRSHYDAKSSPLSISQQTSDSAVRDMALRRGKPQVVADYNSDNYDASPMPPGIQEKGRQKDQRKGKPARLDLSKLFPKPRGAETRDYSNALLSPTKMVNSPAAMSMNSDYHFPRPMTREPTPNPRAQVQLKRTSRQTVSVPPTPMSPVRIFKRDEYDSAKIHVRRPPKGVQHWFDALDEDSDEAVEDKDVPMYAPKAIRPEVVPRIPVRKMSPGRLAPVAINDSFSHEDLVDVARLTSPSQYSLQSTKTKESALSKTNLQDVSVLSCSSSEDEYDDNRSKGYKIAVRKSLDINDDAGEITIGQAQAYEVRPHNRQRSAAQLSTRSTSTNAATIEVMYSPEPPFTPLQYPRTSSYSGSRRSSHMRQPSVIPEDEDVVRPKTAINIPASPSGGSLHSVRTSASEPKSRSNSSHKLMEVTAEEEALLELMRKKRAAMARNLSITHVSSLIEEQDKPRKKPENRYRTSGFLAEASPVRVAETKTTRRASTIPPTSNQLPARGRSLKTHYDAHIGQNQLRDSSASDAWSERHSSPASRVAIPPYLPTPSSFSPLDPFPPSPTATTSVNSTTTIEHASPLPSPITPRLRAYEEVNVKVASSDTSNDTDEVAIIDTGLIGSPPERIKSPSSPHDVSSHRRRRTASSGAEVSFPVPPTHGLTDLAPVSEVNSRPSSIVECALPRLPQKNSKRLSELATLTTAGLPSRRSSAHSSHSRSSLHSHASSSVNGLEKKASKRISRQSSATSMNSNAKGKRNSVSDDVLAAWNSLGGTY